MRTPSSGQELLCGWAIHPSDFELRQALCWYPSKWLVGSLMNATKTGAHKAKLPVQPRPRSECQLIQLPSLARASAFFIRLFPEGDNLEQSTRTRVSLDPNSHLFRLTMTSMAARSPGGVSAPRERMPCKQPRPRGRLEAWNILGHLGKLKAG